MTNYRDSTHEAPCFDYYEHHKRSDLDFSSGFRNNRKMPNFRYNRHNRDWCNMGRNARTLMIIMLITLAGHVILFLNEGSSEPCEPRVVIKREMVTPKPTVPTTPNTAPFVPNKKPAPTQCACPKETDKTATSSGLGNGLLYKDIKPSKFQIGLKKKLFILGYQRVGSSFFGQMFDENPDFFYIYEPLDAVYTEMFATRGGLNVPSDITYHSNGTGRKLTAEENSKVIKLLGDILDCNVDKLPEGFMLHRFWDYLVDMYMPSWNPYRTCLNSTGILTAREDCLQKHLGALCPNRLGTNLTHQVDCQRQLYELEKFGRHKGPKIQPFIQYQDCLHDAYTKGKKCFDIYKEKCTQAHLWATKTVRGTMVQAEQLMKDNPNMRLIHLIRDPRPVVTSRSMDSSYRGAYSGIETVEGGNKAKEATVYCGTMVKDLQYRERLEKLFPGRIIQVIYEDFVQNPGEYAKAIYSFMDEKIPEAVLSWIKSQTEGKKWKNNAMVRMNAWKTRMTFREGELVKENCKNFYSLVKYDWPY